MVSTIPALGVRKGSWTEEEDILLRHCIEKYGEGKWHQVPHRAGLNRCRKSCRLRWLNYLRPNIKRGNFAHDEVDLIGRLHKLLGNRWSLIAGRLPGRTANDVKNYWNTHLRRKHTTIRDDNSHGNASETSASKVLNPQPRTFSRKLREKSISTRIIKENVVNEPSPLVSSIAKDDDVRHWWETLFANSTKDQIGEGTTSWSSLTGSKEEHVKGFWSDEISPRVDQEDDNDLLQETQRGWGDVSIDMDLWDLLGSD